MGAPIGTGEPGTAARSLADELRARGYRMTPQRRLVLEAVEDRGHATPDDVLAACRERDGGVNASTVYRTLDLLEELGLVTHTHLGHGAPTYHPGTAPAHAHLLCRACGRVVAVDPAVVAPFTAALDTGYGFAADVTHLTVEGRCAGCRAGRGTGPDVGSDG